MPKGEREREREGGREGGEEGKEEVDRILPPNFKRARSAWPLFVERACRAAYNFRASVSSLEQFRGEWLYQCDATRCAADRRASERGRPHGSPMNKSHRGKTIFAYIILQKTFQVSFVQLVRYKKTIYSLSLRK